MVIGRNLIMCSFSVLESDYLQIRSQSQLLKPLKSNGREKSEGHMRKVGTGWIVSEIMCTPPCKLPSCCAGEGVCQSFPPTLPFPQQLLLPWPCLVAAFVMVLTGVLPFSLGCTDSGCRAYQGFWGAQILAHRVRTPSCSACTFLFSAELVRVTPALAVMHTPWSQYSWKLRQCSSISVLCMRVALRIELTASCL